MEASPATDLVSLTVHRSVIGEIIHPPLKGVLLNIGDRAFDFSFVVMVATTSLKQDVQEKIQSCTSCFSCPVDARETGGDVDLAVKWECRISASSSAIWAARKLVSFLKWLTPA